MEIQSGENPGHQYRQIVDYNRGMAYQVLEMAAKDGNLELIRYLLSRRDWSSQLNDALHEDAKHGHLDIVRELIQAGARKLDRALLVAVSCGKASVQLVQELISAGAEDLDNALFHASCFSQAEVVHCLIQASATNLDASLIEAAKFGQVNTARILISAGATDFTVISKALQEAGRYISMIDQLGLGLLSAYKDGLDKQGMIDLLNQVRSGEYTGDD